MCASICVRRWASCSSFFLRCLHLILACFSKFAAFLTVFFEFGDLPPLFVKHGLVMHAFGTDLLEVSEFLIPMRRKVLKFMPCGGFVIS